MSGGGEWIRMIRHLLARPQHHAHDVATVGDARDGPAMGELSLESAVSDGRDGRVGVEAVFVHEREG